MPAFKVLKVFCNQRFLKQRFGKRLLQKQQGLIRNAADIGT